MARSGLTDPERKSRRRASYALAAVSSFAVVLYRFPPGQYGFYPRCPVYALTGWECPGCGMTRAFAALVHGHLAEAMHWNPLVLVMVAAFLIWVAAAYRGTTTQFWPKLRGPAVAALIVAAAAFMVVRNLPW